MRRTVRLSIEVLEDRCNPSPLGPPWPDAGQLTLSFAPDGASVNGVPSNLFATLNGVAPTVQWEQIVLKAFQTWAVNANINIGLVADGGQPFGTDGAVQGDTRFGDIRIGMRPLPANLVATTAPFSWTGTTWCGDVILNSSYSFGINVQSQGHDQYDLFTVALHEAGHAFGIPSNTSDANSVMYATYSGPRTGLDSLDIANLQALYGAPTPDAFDAASPNNSLATATSIGNAPAQLGFYADLTTPSDVDYYQLVTPASQEPATVTIQVNAAGVSLVVPTLSVYDAAGNLVVTQTAADSFSNNVTSTLSNVGPDTTYYFEVSSSSPDVFAIGGYAVQISYTYADSSIVGIVPAVIPGTVNGANHSNTSVSAATALSTPFGSSAGPSINYFYQANLVYGGDADYYQVTAPQATSSGGYTLDASVWQTGANGLAPALHLFDANGNPIAIAVQADTTAAYAIHYTGVAPGAVLYLEVAGQTTTGTSSSGGYVVDVTFGPPAVPATPPLGSDTLPMPASSDTGVLAVNQNCVFYFALAATNGSASASSNVAMTVYDPSGNPVMTLYAATGAAPRTTAVLLPAGTYSLVYTVASTVGDYQPVTYWLIGQLLSDPIGPYYTGGPPSPSSGTTSAPAGSNAVTSATVNFASSGVSVSITTAAGTVNVNIPSPGGTSSQTFTTMAGTTTVTVTTDAVGNTTLTVVAPPSNTITQTVNTSGSNSTETLATSDGIQVVITAPITLALPSYSGASLGLPAPYYY